MTEQEHYDLYLQNEYAPEDARSMAAVAAACDVLAAAGWTGPESTGRDIEDPLLMTSPTGAVVELVCSVDYDDAPYDADRPPGTSGSWGEA